MSAITTILDELRSITTTTLSTYTELNNPYVIEDESELKMDKGWALAVGPGENTLRYVCNKESWLRTFVLTLTYRMFISDRDPVNRLIGEKALLEDHKLIKSAFEDSPHTSARTKTTFESDNGIEFLSGDRFNIMVLQSTIMVEYHEN